MKSVLFLLVSMSLFTINASEFGEISKEVRFEETSERVHKLIANSAETRRLLTGRSIAGMTKQEEEWANSYQKLINDKKDDTDYLELSLKL